MNWIIGIAILVIVGYILDREIYFYEGVHLGPRVQAWLYDRWSRNYDAGKRESQLRDDEMLAQPLLDATQAVPAPFVLDFAAGTGRLSYALTSRPEFTGRIVALDLSQGMLEEAIKKLSRAPEGASGLRERSEPPGGRSRSADKQDMRHSNPMHALSSGQENAVPPLSFGYDVSARVEFLRHQTLPLPFPDLSFDVVCALEVLELFPSMDKPLAEFARVLRPGGVFLTSRGTEESGRRAKVRSVEAFTSLLEKNGFVNVQVVKWWKLFDRVLAVKQGSSNPVKKRGLQEVLKCSNCENIQWHGTANSLKCGGCGNVLTVTGEGIVLG